MAIKNRRRKKAALTAVILGLSITSAAPLTACSGKKSTSDMQPPKESVNEISVGDDIKEPMTDGMWLNN